MFNLCAKNVTIIIVVFLTRPLSAWWRFIPVMNIFSFLHTYILPDLHYCYNLFKRKRMKKISKYVLRECRKHAGSHTHMHVCARALVRALQNITRCTTNRVTPLPSPSHKWIHNILYKILYIVILGFSSPNICMYTLNIVKRSSRCFKKKKSFVWHRDLYIIYKNTSNADSPITHEKMATHTHSGRRHNYRFSIILRFFYHGYFIYIYILLFKQPCKYFHSIGKKKIVKRCGRGE